MLSSLVERELKCCLKAVISVDKLFRCCFFFSTMNMDGFHLKKKIGKETKMAKTSELKM